MLVGEVRGVRTNGGHEEMKLPAFDQPQTALREAEAERTFWERHGAALGRQYPDQFIAVRDCEVVASSDDLPDLVAQLEAKGISPVGLWIRFLESNPRRLVL